MSSLDSNITSKNHIEDVQLLSEKVQMPSVSNFVL